MAWIWIRRNRKGLVLLLPVAPYVVYLRFYARLALSNIVLRRVHLLGTIARTH